MPFQIFHLFWEILCSPMLKKLDPPDENARITTFLLGDLHTMNQDSTTLTSSLSAYTVAAIFSSKSGGGKSHDNPPIDLDCDF